MFASVVLPSFLTNNQPELLGSKSSQNWLRSLDRGAGLIKLDDTVRTATVGKSAESQAAR